MKKPSYTLSIPQPCDERWDAMNPSEKGRFCGSCQKQVVDFSGFSDREVIQMIEQASGKVCGRLHPQQLNRPMVLKPWAQRASVRFSGFFAGLMLLYSADAAFSQVKSISTEVVSTQVENGKSVETGKSLPEKFTIKGLITVADSGESVPFANIIPEVPSAGTTTDFDGTYSLKISSRILREADTVTFFVTCVGFERYEFSISRNELAHGITKNIQLKPIKIDKDYIVEPYYTRGLIHVD
jgi:hypothetical protein